MTAWLKSHTANIILLILGISVLIFTVVMIWLFILTGSIPDTLCTCFFAAVTGECGFMGWIKTARLKTTERQWKLEDKADEDKTAELKRAQTMQALREQEGNSDSNRS